MRSPYPPGHGRRRAVPLPRTTGGVAPSVSAVLAFVALVLPSAAGAQYGLVTLPMADPAYIQLTALEHLGCAAARVSVDRPYEVRLSAPR